MNSFSVIANQLKDHVHKSDDISFNALDWNQNSNKMMLDVNLDHNEVYVYWLGILMCYDNTQGIPETCCVVCFFSSFLRNIFTSDYIFLREFTLKCVSSDERVIIKFMTQTGGTSKEICQLSVWKRSF